MTDFFFRTEDIRPDEVLDYYVETQKDRILVNSLKSRNPTILVGSRGVGKSFLLRVAQAELQKEFETSKVLPVYVSFVRSSLLSSSDPDQFKHWMLAKICAAITRSLEKNGLLSNQPRGIKILAGGKVGDEPTQIETIAAAYEDSWRDPSKDIDGSAVPTIDDVKEALEDACEVLDVRRINLLIDEAAHIFLPEQQRQFFTLFRDLRSHCITCNAAVYPGVTSFGETFQPVHDATMLSIDRDVLSQDYIANMREIVEKQADSQVLSNIAQNGRNFAILAFAATGNPRLLLKTLARAPKVNSSQVNEALREYYRTEIWSEHSTLAEKYFGHKDLIDWGRTFIEGIVLPDVRQKNEVSAKQDRSTSAFFWINRDAPEVIKESLRVLAYTGVVVENADGIKASGAIGKRYMVNLGCLFAQEATPSASAFDVATSLSAKRSTEYGPNHPSYKSLADNSSQIVNASIAPAIQAQLDKTIDVLDITPWQKEKLTELGLTTIRSVLSATEEKLKEAIYVGDVRARRMRNAAIAAVMEYLSG
jgi:hypothetical protein